LHSVPNYIGFASVNIKLVITYLTNLMLFSLYCLDYFSADSIDQSNKH